MGCDMVEEAGKKSDPVVEIYRLRSLITRTKEMVMASVHHLILGATVCDAAGFPESAKQMTEMIDRLRLLAAQLEAAGSPDGGD